MTESVITPKVFKDLSDSVITLSSDVKHLGERQQEDRADSRERDKELSKNLLKINQSIQTLHEDRATLKAISWTTGKVAGAVAASCTVVLGIVGVVLKLGAS